MGRNKFCNLLRGEKKDEDDLPPQQGPIPPSKWMMRLMPTPQWQQAVEEMAKFDATVVARQRSSRRIGRPRKVSLQQAS